MDINTVQHIQRGLRFILYPISRIYGFVLHLRRWFWEHKAKQYRARIPVISVGNIAWGGTGKTPLVQHLISFYVAHGIRPTLISRGYKHKGGVGYPICVDTTQFSAETIGDEPYMLAKNNRDISVLVDYKRVRAMEYAEKNLQQDCFILDDAMQHLAVARDANIVVLRVQDLEEEWNAIIPRGSWREPVSALCSATAFCMKCSLQEWEYILPAVQKKLLSYGVPIYSYCMEITGVYSVLQNTALESAVGMPYSILSGIGSPHSFLESITTYMGYAPVMHYVCSDHASAKELENAIASCKTTIICTEKDAVKLGASKANIYYTKTGILFGPYIGNVPFEQFSMEVYRKHCTIRE